MQLEGAAGPRRPRRGEEHRGDQHLRGRREAVPVLPPPRSLRGPEQDAFLPAERRDGDNSGDHGARGDGHNISGDHGACMRSCQNYENNADRGQPRMGWHDNENNSDCDYDDFDEMLLERTVGGQPSPDCHDYENIGQDGMDSTANDYEALAGRRDPANIYCKMSNNTD